MAAFLDLSHNKMDIIRFFYGSDLKENIRVGASKIFICNGDSICDGDSPHSTTTLHFVRKWGQSPIKVEIFLCESEKIHPFKIFEGISRLGEDDSFSDAIYLQKLAYLKKADHAVRVHEGNFAKVYLLRLSEITKDEVKGFFDNLGHFLPLSSLYHHMRMRPHQPSFFVSYPPVPGLNNRFQAPLFQREKQLLYLAPLCMSNQTVYVNIPVCLNEFFYVACNG